MEQRILIAIDPGDIESGYVVVSYSRDAGITKILEKGKALNEDIFPVFERYLAYDFAIEMIASYGMAVGATVFDTCVYIGRLVQRAYDVGRLASRIQYVYRKEEKLCLCGTTKAKDANIAQALADHYAPGQKNRGKGTKQAPGFFYGFSADMWAAMAVAHTAVESRRRKEDKTQN